MRRTVGAIVAAVGVAALVGSGTAAAVPQHDGADRGSSVASRAGTAKSHTRWTRYHQADFSYAAGEACSFGVHAKVVRDREYYKNVAFYSDGTVKIQLFKGPLVVNYKNDATGKTIRKNLSGRAFEEFNPDGSFSSITVQSGHFGTSLPAGSQPAKGLYRVGGRWSSLTINPDGTRTVVLGPHGTIENLCVELAAAKASQAAS